MPSPTPADEASVYQYSLYCHSACHHLLHVISSFPEKLLHGQDLSADSTTDQETRICGCQKSTGSSMLTSILPRAHVLEQQQETGDTSLPASACANFPSICATPFLMGKNSCRDCSSNAESWLSNINIYIYIPSQISPTL